MKKAIVIGSGIAGIATALRLNKNGYEVSVFESNSYAGGKIHAFTNKGYRYDMGPSLFTMPQLVDELFILHNKNPKDYFNYSRKDVVCNYFWDDGKRFSAPANQGEFINSAAIEFNTSHEVLRNYLTGSKEKYDLTENIFLRKSLHKWSTYLSFSTLKSLIQVGKLHINKNLDQVNRQYFDNPKLRQLFNRYATYNGSSPYKTPGIMSMIPHLEMHYGTFYPKGGMHEISQSLYRLAKDVGVSFHFDEPVTAINITDKVAEGITTAKAIYKADLVISNMDIFGTYQNLLNEEKQPKKILQQERSSSAIIFYWGVHRESSELDLHNILFSKDYQEEFNKIFEEKILADDLTVYINITSKEDESDAPEGCENWFVMVNAPANFGQDWKSLIAKARLSIITKINTVLKIKIEDLIDSEQVLDPIGIETKTGSHRGSLYGTSSNSKFSAFLRHANFSSAYKNVFFCGGSVHPGGGIPLCLLSAKITADLCTKP
ncbi:phytoene desaturase [Cryomorpha ignava]|uniref:Phytoene desaturase n=1 Tax=Cryomorpha ignava TaxID=101383 RepID=A0A7K3WMU5_9FLAO|nr:1-hydroxycarotenoid 3,4-desaturase CrtD [Cryomorpha ignava]NEN22321.1 phytoene desaturase [Cryomorpha ignava]